MRRFTLSIFLVFVLVVDIFGMESYEGKQHEESKKGESKKRAVREEESQTFDLRNDTFAFENEDIKNYILKTVQSDHWNKSIEKKDKENLLRVELLAFNVKEKSWYSFSNKLIYESGWSLSKGINKETIDPNPKQGFTKKHLCDFYESEESLKEYAKSKACYVTTCAQNEDTKIKIINDFSERGIEKPFTEKGFNYAFYAHSEQAFISDIQGHKDGESLEFDQYSKFVLVLGSTRKPCDACKKTLTYILDNTKHDGSFLKNIFTYFTAQAEKKLVSSEKQKDSENHQNKTFSILYSYLLYDPPKADDLLLDHNLYLLPTGYNAIKKAKYQ